MKLIIVRALLLILGSSLALGAENEVHHEQESTFYTAVVSNTFI